MKINTVFRPVVATFVTSLLVLAPWQATANAAEKGSTEQANHVDYLGHNHSADNVMDMSEATFVPLEEASKQNIKYVCPMHPQIIRDHQTICPICGMDLVKKVFEDAEGAPRISAGSDGVNGIKQGLAIRTVKVQKNTLWRYIPTFGKVVADETKVIHLHPRAAGWISDLSVHRVGDSVKKGQLLYRFYSPEIVSAQQDYLLALQNRKSGVKSGGSVVESAKARLELLGVSETVIEQIARNKKTVHKVPMYAKQGGVLSSFSVQDGMYIEPRTELMSISDLSHVWVEAEVLPLQQSWVKNGLVANLTSQAFPGQRWESQIEYMYPLTDAKTQALKVRLPIQNSPLLLKPNMFMDVEIYGGPKHDALIMPLEAVIDDGVTQRVVIKRDDGLFEVVQVVLGIQSEGLVEVLSGVELGQRIVVSGQFLIDSESQVQSNLRRLISSEQDANPHISH